MAEKNLERTRRQPFHGFLQVAHALERRPADILHADKRYRLRAFRSDFLTAADNPDVTVHQQMPADFFFQILQYTLVALCCRLPGESSFPFAAPVPIRCFHPIFTVIMVAHDTVDTIRSGYPAEVGKEREHLVCPHIHQVASKNHQVRILSVDNPHQLPDKPRITKISAEVEVAQL